MQSYFDVGEFPEAVSRSLCFIYELVLLFGTSRSRHGNYGPMNIYVDLYTFRTYRLYLTKRSLMFESIVRRKYLTYYRNHLVQPGSRIQRTSTYEIIS